MARLRPDQLSAALKKGQTPIYLITGDEPLLAQEACEEVRAYARKAGFTEREVHHTDAGFTWDMLSQSANSLSLFSEKKLIEIRVHNGKPGDAGSKAICEYCANVSEDNLLLLIFPKLDKPAQSTKWYKALDNAGDIVTIWPINPQQLPRWVDQRLKAVGLHAKSEAIEILCAKVEGNLLAAKQEIEKLRLLADKDIIDANTMSACVMESARYDLFSLVDKALYGDTPAVTRTLQGLRSEGMEAPVVLWALAREIRTLLSLHEHMSTGQNFDIAARSLRIWDKRKPIIKQAIKRLTAGHLCKLLRFCSLTDKAIKGGSSHDPWQLINDIALELSGNPVLTMRTQQQILHNP